MIKRVSLSRFAASFVSVSLLAICAATAQNGPAVDRLLKGGATNLQLRAIDTSVRAANRYAIVIGNADYASIPTLKNALADARVTAAFLKSQGYDVQYHENITKRGFESMLRRVLFDVDKDTEVVVFFAGHGFQIGSEKLSGARRCRSRQHL